MPAKTIKAAVRPRRFKAEVEQEFSAIQDEVTAAREASAPKTDELFKAKEAEIRQAVDGVTVEGVVQTISSLGLEVSKALSDLSEKLVQEVDRLGALREAAALERKEIERLHKIDVAATALDQLVQDHEREKQRLNAEISAQRAAWEEEAREAERRRKEEEDSLKKQRQRETDEYEYKKAQERRKAQDKYDEERALAEKQNREKQEALEKNWQQRDRALREKEEEFARLKREAEEFPARLRKEAEDAAAQAVRSVQQKFERQIALLEKETEAEKRLNELRVKTLEETIAQRNAQIATLQKQLDEAKQQVQEIAVKAIEGASGAKALSHINSIAMEQAKHRVPQS